LDEDKKIQTAVDNFNAMSDSDRKQLQSINARIQSRTGEWGIRHEDEHTESGALIVPWIEQAKLIQEFVRFMYEKKLIIAFAWTEWQEGRDWYALQGDSKYDKLDVETILKLLTAVIRNDRFNDGALERAFELGAFPKIIQKLITI
jgi:hypothetical protein